MCHVRHECLSEKEEICKTPLGVKQEYPNCFKIDATPQKVAGEESNSTALLLCQGFEGPCSRTDVKRQRQNTRYENDELNWVTLCPDCAAANEKRWHEMWREYYAGCL